MNTQDLIKRLQIGAGTSPDSELLLEAANELLYLLALLAQQQDTITAYKYRELK